MSPPSRLTLSHLTLGFLVSRLGRDWYLIIVSIFETTGLLVSCTTTRFVAGRLFTQYEPAPESGIKMFRALIGPLI